MQGADAAQLELLQRQVAEIEALQSMYPDAPGGALCLAPLEQEALLLAQRVLAGSCAALSATDVPCLAGTLRAEHEALSAALRSCLAEAAGAECLLLAAERLKEEVAALSAAGGNACPLERTAGTPACTGGAPLSAHPHPGPGPGRDGAALVPPPTCFLTVIIWFHHIKSPTKRKLIVQWARELRLGGASKPGFPGVVVAQGEEPDVRDFVARVRSLTWQAMQVRAEELSPPPDGKQGPQDHQKEEAGQDRRRDGGALATASCATSARACSRHSTAAPPPRQPPPPGALPPFTELGESGMSDLSTLCAGAGISGLFLAALKIVPSRASGGEG